MLVNLFQYKIIKEGLSFVPDIILPLRLVGCCCFFCLFRVLHKVSAVPPHFMESRERCFLPVLLCTGPGPAGLGGTPLLSGKPALGDTAPL